MFSKEDDRAFKDAALKDAVTEKDGGQEKDEGSKTFFNPEQQESLTPLILKHIKAHECLYQNYNPGYPNTVYDHAHTEAQNNFKISVTVDARVDLYNTAAKRLKEEIKTGARKNVLKELKEKIRKEVVAEYQKKLKAGFEKQWIDSKKAAVKEEVQVEYEAMLVRMRGGV